MNSSREIHASPYPYRSLLTDGEMCGKTFSIIKSSFNTNYKVDTSLKIIDQIVQGKFLCMFLQSTFFCFRQLFLKPLLGKLVVGDISKFGNSFIFTTLFTLQTVVASESYSGQKTGKEVECPSLPLIFRKSYECWLYMTSCYKLILKKRILNIDCKSFNKHLLFYFYFVIFFFLISCIYLCYESYKCCYPCLDYFYIGVKSQNFLNVDYANSIRYPNSLHAFSFNNLCTALD